MDLVSVWTARAIRPKKNCHPFERLGLSVRKKCHPFEQLELSVWQKIVIHSNGSSYPFEKETADHFSSWSYLFKDRLLPSFHLKTILSLATGAERSVILQVFLSGHIPNFVYKCIRNSYESLLLCSHLHFHIIIRLSRVLEYILFNT